MIDIRMEGAEYADLLFGRFITRLPEVTVELPREVETPVMGLIMAGVRSHTPLLSGELEQDTDWREASSSEDQVHIEIFSSAQNDRTGFEYAKARAYGFNTVSGAFWEPPEDPPYPVAGAEDAASYIAGTAEKVVRERLMALFVIPH